MRRILIVAALTVCAACSSQDLATPETAASRVGTGSTSTDTAITHGTGGGLPLNPGTTQPPVDSSLIDPIATSRTVTGTVTGVLMNGADSGKVVGPVAGATVSASQSVTGGNTAVGSATTDASGQFTLSQMPGTLLILTITPPAGSDYAKGVTYVYPSSTTSVTVVAHVYTPAAH
jgi:hypothetical protein